MLFHFLKVVPIPKNKVDEAKTAFTEFGQMQNIDFADVPEDKDLQEVHREFLIFFNYSL